jgi:hypothetical protein
MIDPYSFKVNTKCGDTYKGTVEVVLPQGSQRVRAILQNNGNITASQLVAETPLGPAPASLHYIRHDGTVVVSYLEKWFAPVDCPLRFL